MNLVIVESPSKAKTIQKYLGKDYTVDASGGHIMDLPEKKLGIDLKNNYEPEYVVNPLKKDVVKRLKEQSKKADTVLLATDPDREGEAISWHLANILKISSESKNRIVFNEISQKAVNAAISQPREININLVNAQQARRVLDRLVGYKISPLLCKRISNKLSAGRVQSVALRLIVEREKEIQDFVPVEYWTITAELSASEGGEKDIIFKAVLASKNGKKFKPGNKDEADEVLSAVKNSLWTVKSIKASQSKSHAPAPFTTSTLQQDASNKLGLSSPITMSLAQNLYEGVDIQGEGQTALVTYIRTDSVRVSQDAQSEALRFIESTYGKEYVPKQPNIYRSKKSAQDAHEAIRPISLEKTPESLKNKLQKNHYRLYKLIYERFLASQFSEAIYDTMSIDIESSGYIFKSSGKSLVFKGYTIVYDDYKEDGKENDDGENARLPKLTQNQMLKLQNIKGEQKFTRPPARYNDASLVKAMEEKGIGRPSTYASIISVLIKRKYTEKEGKSLKPTELGINVNELLLKYFESIINVKFTAGMEEQLDKIEEGGQDWKELISLFYPNLEKKLKNAMEDSVEISEEICEKCGSNMVVKVGRYGKFLACPNYPECKNIKSLDEPEVSEEVCEKCGAKMMYRNGKYGRYLSCTNYPECKNIKAEGEEKSDEKCPDCSAELVIRQGRYGKYLYCKECKKIIAKNEKAGTCPKCGKDVVKKFTKGKKLFFGCSGYPECDFASWDKPTEKKCPKCGGYTVLKNYKDGDKILCADKKCDYSESVE